jgi:hypothetical protein
MKFVAKEKIKTPISLFSSFLLLLWIRYSEPGTLQPGYAIRYPDTQFEI